MTDTAFPCAQCGAVHDLSQCSFGFAHPDPYFAVPEDEREKRCYWTSDVATIDSKHFFVRTILPLAAEGRDSPFTWGLWVKIAREDYEYYLDHWEDPDVGQRPPFPGRLVSQIRSYPRTLGLPVHVQLVGPTARPTIQVTDSEHPLAVEQREGISLETLKARFLACVHADTWTPSGYCRIPGPESRNAK